MSKFRKSANGKCFAVDLSNVSLESFENIKFRKRTMLLTEESS